MQIGFSGGAGLRDHKIQRLRWRTLQIWNQQTMGRLGSKPRKAAILGEELGQTRVERALHPS